MDTDDDDYEALLAELDGISTSPVKASAPAASLLVRVPWCQMFADIVHATAFITPSLAPLR